jgi:hypothetical protein
MMLLFTYTLQELFVRVRSFVFVSDVGEVTQYFKDLDVDQAIDLATAGKAGGGGVPLAALAGRGDIMGTLDARNQPREKVVWATHTLNGNPICAAAGSDMAGLPLPAHSRGRPFPWHSQ